MLSAAPGRLWQPVWLILWVTPAQAAVEQAWPRLVDSAAALAVATGETPSWRVLAAGDVLPQQCRIRTSEGPPCLVELGGAHLHVGPGGRLELDATARRLAVTRGRIRLAIDEADDWSIDTGDARWQARGGTTVDVTVEAAAARVDVLAGGLALDTAEAGPLHCAAGHSVQFELATGRTTSAPLDEAQRQRIAAWSVNRRRPQGIGQLLVEDAQRGAWDRLNVARYHVNVVLQPPVALVQIDQSFYNPHAAQREGTFVFNLPPGAAVSRFAMYVTRSELIEGELIEQRRASNIYETIVRGQRDPAILEQIGDNLFRMRIFPIFARDTKRVLLDYTVPLESQGSDVRFQLPLLSDLEPIVDFQVAGTIATPCRRESLASPTHPDVAFEPQPDGSAGFRLVRRDYRPQGDLVVQFRENRAATAAVRVYRAEPLPPRAVQAGAGTLPASLSWRGREAQYFVAALAPEVRAAPPPDTRPADVIVVADTSSGMTNHDATLPAVRTIVQNLRAGDRCRLAALDVASRWLDDAWLRPDSLEAEKTLARLQRELCLGGTDLEAGLTGVLGGFDPGGPDRRRIVVYVGDGHDTLGGPAGQRLEQAIADRFADAEAQLFAVVVCGHPAGRQCLERLAPACRGTVFDATAAAPAYGELLSWLLSGLPSPQALAAIEVPGADAADLFVNSWSTLPGRTQYVFGRMQPNSEITLRLTYVDAPRPVEIKLPVDFRRDDVFVGRMWAQQMLDYLLGSTATAFSRSPEILALSEEWSLLSPGTAFLVLETESDYARWGIDRRQRRRYWQPPAAVQPVPLPPAWQVGRFQDQWAVAQADRLARALAWARQALAEEDHRRADAVLRSAAGLPGAAESDELARLIESATAGLRRLAAREALGPYRTLFDPTTEAAPLTTPNVWTLLAGEAGTDYLRRHPQALRLLKEITVPTGDTTLSDVVRTLEEFSGLSVAVSPEVAGLGPSLQESLRIHATGKLALRDYARYALGQMDLALVETAAGLLITTQAKVDETHRTEVYPVADLLLTGRVAQPEQLTDLYRDREETAARRLRAALERPVDVELDDTPLADLADYLASVLKEAVVIDVRAIESEVRLEDVRLKGRMGGMPLAASLQALLVEWGLAYVTDRGALQITTLGQAEEHFVTRRYSGIGLLYEYPVDESAAPSNGWPDSQVGAAGGRALGGLSGGGLSGGGGGGGGGGAFFGGGAGGGPGGSFGGAGMFRVTTAGTAAAGGAQAVRLPADAGAVGISGVAPATASADAATAIDRPQPDTAGIQASQTSQGLQGASSETPRQHYLVDASTLIDQVMWTISPTEWMDVGGRGAIDFFAPTLDLVVTASEDTHDQLAALFDQFGRLPPVFRASNGIRPARIRDIGPQDMREIDEQAFLSLLTTHVAPTTWADVGGSGSILLDMPRLALLVRQTAAAHDELCSLLTSLRRSRYEQLRGPRPWAGAAWDDQRPLCALDLWEAVDGLSALGQVDAEELAALAVRRQPAEGRWCWQYSGPRGASAVLSLHQTDGRAEFGFGTVVARVAGATAALGYPTLGLAEVGPWADAVRRQADIVWPWWPHRSNEELARLFVVRALDRTDEDAARRVRRVRFAVNGRQQAPALVVAFSGEHGLPLWWEATWEGQVVARLEFEELAAGQGPPRWQRVRRLDGQGNTVAQWQLVQVDPARRPLPMPQEAWPELARLDRPAPGDDASPLVRAVEAIRRYQWPTAAAALRAALDRQPEQPWLLFLLGWCYMHDDSTAPRDAVLGALERIAASEATDLTGFIAAGGIQFASPGELYRVLSRQPRRLRTAAGSLQAARLALRAGLIDEALVEADAALAAGSPLTTRHRFDCQRLRVEALLERLRRDEACRAAESWCAEVSATADQIGELGGLFARFGRPRDADRILGLGLAREDLDRQQRCRLLRQRAEVNTGWPRWQMLVEACELLPADSVVRQPLQAMLLAEFSTARDAASAGQLAAATSDLSLHRELRFRQAELTADPQETAELYWRIYQDGLLAGSSAWACYRWNSTGQPERAVEVLEARLRAGARLLPDERKELQIAYRKLGRPTDAVRAATND